VRAGRRCISVAAGCRVAGGAKRDGRRAGEQESTRSKQDAGHARDGETQQARRMERTMSWAPSSEKDAGHGRQGRHLKRMMRRTSSEPAVKRAEPQLRRNMMEEDSAGAP